MTQPSRSQTGNRKIVIVGGVAGGATAAARARRLDEHAEIVLLERGPDIAFANCGLPYHIGGEIEHRDALRVQTVAGLKARYNLDIRTRSEAVAIDRDRRTVRIVDHAGGRTYDESYDALLLSPGAAPVRPPLPGADHAAVCTLRNLQDMDRIRAAAATARDAVVVGGGFIGIEMAENLRRRGLHVTLVELLPQVLPPMDPEFAERVRRELVAHGVTLRLGESVTGFEDHAGRLRVGLRGGSPLEADLVILAVGVRPDTQLARDAGLELNQRGAIVVDEHMRTSDPHIYAVGDAVEVTDAVLGGPTMLPLAGPANRQARIAADNICGRPSTFRGVQGTAIVRAFGLTAACTGASEKTLRQRGVAYESIYVFPKSHAGYFPGAEQMMLKLLFAPPEGHILGAQIVGGDGVDKRIDVLALAIQAHLTTFDLEQAELAYAPQFGSAKDPINIAGFVAGNKLRGDVHCISPAAVDPQLAQRYTLIDVRNPDELAGGTIPGSINIPLPLLRKRLDDIPRDKPLLVFCAVGQRGYYACRCLSQRGFECASICGGFAAYDLAAGASDVP